MDIDAVRILRRLVRVGTVMDIDTENHMARVKFHDEDLPSGWLFVLQHCKSNLYIQPDGQHTHTVHDTYTGGGYAQSVPNHNHPGYVTYWMPEIDDAVVCLSLPLNDGDGYILGGI